jgi:mRNA interferase MazF
MNERDVILTSLPQADGSRKNRPVVILRKMPGFGDLLVCGVSTQLHQKVDSFDEIISPSDADFAQSGLLKESLIRLGYLAVLSGKTVLGSIGEISVERHHRLLETLARYITDVK